MHVPRSILFDQPPPPYPSYVHRCTPQENTWYGCRGLTLNINPKLTRVRNYRVMEGSEGLFGVTGVQIEDFEPAKPPAPAEAYDFNARLSAVNGLDDFELGDPILIPFEGLWIEVRADRNDGDFIMPQHRFLHDELGFSIPRHRFVRDELGCIGQFLWTSDNFERHERVQYQARKHRNKRINKKWLKRYGLEQYIRCDTCDGRVVALHPFTGKQPITLTTEVKARLIFEELDHMDFEDFSAVHKFCERNAISYRVGEDARRYRKFEFVWCDWRFTKSVLLTPTSQIFHQK